MPSRDQILAAREAVLSAMQYVGFGGELELFAAEHPPPRTLDEGVSAGPSYFGALRQFAESWGLSRDWFLNYVNDQAFALAHGFETPPPSGGLTWPVGAVTMRLDFVLDRASLPPTLTVEQDAYHVSGSEWVWPSTGRAEVRERFIELFDGFWESIVRLEQEKHPLWVERERDFPNLQRDARYFVARLMVGRKKPAEWDAIDIIGATQAEQRRLWRRMKPVDDLSAERALRRFKVLLRDYPDV